MLDFPIVFSYDIYMNQMRLTSVSQKLRKSMTPQEIKLWSFLKQLPVTVNRQKVIGNYIVDFYCASAKLVIEVDGSQHYEEKGIISDVERDNYLSEHGYSIVRYSNREVNSKYKAVCDDLYKRIFG